MQNSYFDNFPITSLKIAPECLHLFPGLQEVVNKTMGQKPNVTVTVKK